MRILLVNTYYAPEIYGGAEYSVKKLAEALVKAGHDVCVFCTGAENAEEVIDSVRVVRVKSKHICRAAFAASAPKFKRLIRRLQDIWNPLNGPAIIKILETFQPEVIHTNGLYDISPVIWKIAKKKNIRVVHTLRDYFLVCPRVTLSCEQVEGRCPLTICKVHRRENRKHSQYVDCVTAPSSVTLNLVTGYKLFEKAKKVVIPNACDYSDDELAENYDRRKNNRHPFSFVYLGTLSEQKGIRWMIESFGRLEKDTAELYIAGKGELLNYVQSAAEENVHIHYVGFLSEREVSALLSRCDVLLCPSQWEEPFGRVVLDAYKNAMPVIASNRGALPDLVKHNETGIIVESGNMEELVKAMSSYIQTPGLVLQHSYNAIKELKSYSIETQVEMFVKIYDNA